MYAAPNPYEDDPRKIGQVTGSAPQVIDPERRAMLQAMYGGGQPAPAPDSSAEELPPAPPPADTTPAAAPAPQVAATPASAPAPEAPSGYTPPQGAPNSTWHDIQGFAAGFAGPEYLRMFQQRDQAANANAAALALKDPRSPQSVQARAAAAPFLQKMGFAPEDIARLSVADINGAGGLASLMKQAAALKAAEAKAKETEATWQQHNATTSGQVDARNHEMAQATLGREQEMAGTQHKFATEQQARGADLSLRNAETLAAEAEARQLEKEARKAAIATKSQKDLADNYGRANEYLEFRDPELLASAYQSRGKNKLNTDLQQASVLHNASKDIGTIRDAAEKAAAAGDVAKAYALNEKYHLAVNKAADALVGLGGNSSDAAKKAALAKFPSIANPFGAETLKELQDELDNIIDDKIGSAYGGVVRRGGAKAPAPAAQGAPSLGTAPAGPKVNSVVKQGGMLHLSDGTSAPDTAKNRAIIQKAGLTFEAESPTEDASEPGEEQ